MRKFDVDGPSRGGSAAEMPRPGLALRAGRAGGAGVGCGGGSPRVHVCAPGVGGHWCQGVRSARERSADGEETELCPDVGKVAAKTWRVFVDI